MSKSAMLRVADVRAVFRLVGDCRDVGGDPTQWQRVAFEGAYRLAGGFATTGGEGIWLRPSQALQPMTSCVVGFDESGYKLFLAYMREHGVLADPIFQRMQHASSDRIVTRTRPQLIANREWYRSASFDEYRKPGGFDHQLTSLYQVSARGAIHSMNILRAIGDRDFSARERCVISLFHDELGRLIGRALVSGIEPALDALSPRLRQTLTCLLDGDSEKQVAARLGLSHSTVHQYITVLYRRFGVRSRAALMSLVLARRDRPLSR